MHDCLRYAKRCLKGKYACCAIHLPPDEITLASDIWVFGSVSTQDPEDTVVKKKKKSFQVALSNCSTSGFPLKNCHLFRSLFGQLAN